LNEFVEEENKNDLQANKNYLNETLTIYANDT
jgi:hypothetical protein